jgi:hypothetical protein
MDTRMLGRLAVLGWVLLQATGGNDWRLLDTFVSETTCERVRVLDVANDTRNAIGSALADQPVDNPMRQEAFRRVEPRMNQHYRCQWQKE